MHIGKKHCPNSKMTGFKLTINNWKHELRVTIYSSRKMPIIKKSKHDSE